MVVNVCKGVRVLDQITIGCTEKEQDAIVGLHMFQRTAVPLRCEAVQTEHPPYCNNK